MEDTEPAIQNEDVVYYTGVHHSSVSGVYNGMNKIKYHKTDRRHDSWATNAAQSNLGGGSGRNH